jgi:hypothetical protein
VLLLQLPVLALVFEYYFCHLIKGKTATTAKKTQNNNKEKKKK